MLYGIFTEYWLSLVYLAHDSAPSSLVGRDVAKLCMGLGLLRRPAQPYMSTFFQDLPIREPNLQVYQQIQSSGHPKDGVHICLVDGCGENFSRLVRAALHVRTRHHKEEVNWDL